MATAVWQGGVTAVAQHATGSIDTYDAASTYTVTIGGYPVSVAGDTDVATTAANLVTALNASTNPYFAAITWDVPSGSTVGATADTAGMPFTAALTVSGGTGTVTDFSDTTACTGPHHADAGDNWSTGVVPAASDDVVVEGGPSILYGLDGFSATALGRVEVRQAYTGKIGLEASGFATSLDGETVDGSLPEYRDVYLEVTADEIVIGEHIGPGTPTGSARIAVEQKKAGASVLDVVDTGTSSVFDRPAVRYIAGNAAADVVIRSAPSGVGIAVEPGETATVGDVYVADTSTTSNCYIGPGTTLTQYEQAGGISTISAAATITTVNVLGGTLRIVGYDYLITSLNVYGGETTDTHENTGGAEWTTINCYGGELALPLSTAGTARAFTTANLYGGQLEADWSAVSGTVAIPTDDKVTALRSVEVTAL